MSVRLLRDKTSLNLGNVESIRAIVHLVRNTPYKVPQKMTRTKVTHQTQYKGALHPQVQPTPPQKYIPTVADD